MRKVKHSPLFFIAAGLAAIAAILNLVNNDGLNVALVAGSIMGLVMLWLGIAERRKGN
jgi:DMSO reductase anchor subunit